MAGIKDTGGDPRSREAGFELRDINVPALIKSGVVLTVVCVIVWLLMMALFKVFATRAADVDPAPAPMALPADREIPGPRLLTDEPGNLRQFADREDELLHSYGWVDEAAGQVRIPIDRAKELLLEQPLPVRGQ